MSTLIICERPKLNVFELDTSRTYFYEIILIGRGHTGMTVRVHDDIGGYKDGFNIGFWRVEYVDAPTTWKGGIFRTATTSECRRLRTDLGMHIPTPSPLDPYIPDTENYALYEAATENGKFVRILASVGVEIYRESIDDNEWKRAEAELLKRIDTTQGDIPVIRREGKPSVYVDELLNGLVYGEPVKDKFGLESEDIQAALLFARDLYKKTYRNSS